MVIQNYNISLFDFCVSDKLESPMIYAFNLRIITKLPWKTLYKEWYSLSEKSPQTNIFKFRKAKTVLSTMAAMNQISDLKPFKSMWKIKVKIIRLWRQYTAATGETIEMVFVDARVRIWILVCRFWYDFLLYFVRVSTDFSLCLSY